MQDLEPNLDFDKQSSKINNKLIKSMEKVKINKTEVVKLLEAGVTKTEVRDQLYPSLNNMQWIKALKMMGLSSMKVKKVDFIIEDETVIGIPSIGNNPAYTTEA